MVGARRNQSWLKHVQISTKTQKLQDAAEAMEHELLRKHFPKHSEHRKTTGGDPENLHFRYQNDRSHERGREALRAIGRKKKTGRDTMEAKISRAVAERRGEEHQILPQDSDASKTCQQNHAPGR
jgi:hypothetical protein